MLIVIRTGRVEAVKLLIERKTGLDAKVRGGETPLGLSASYAAKYGFDSTREED